MRRNSLILFFLLFAFMSYAQSFNAAMGIALNMHDAPGVALSGDVNIHVINTPGLYAVFGGKLAINSYEYTTQNIFNVTETYNTVGSIFGIKAGVVYKIRGLFERNVLVPFMGIAGNFSYYASGEPNQSAIIIRPEIDIGMIFAQKFFFSFDITQPVYLLLGMTF